MERYSFSGKGNIIIKAATAGRYGNLPYEVNEPIAYFTNVFVSLNFQYLEKMPRQGIDNLVVSAKSSPSFLQVSNIKLSESLQSLLYKKKVFQNKKRTYVKSLVSESSSLFLPIQSGETVLTEIFIYNSHKIKQKDYVLNSSTGEITGLADGTYTVFYIVNKSADAIYLLEAPQFPYLAVEIQVEGNLNGSTGEAVIHLDKVQLLTRPTLDMASETPFVDSLDFAIMGDSVAEVNYYG